ncbi:MAG: GNAT family N-acetyltransferase [Oscillochloridaceae bacterium]|nr:GNAT family N-acetyltransferase [Chloroflexaceae bacterium]MDW8392062.1 GNAT family N-acetyltransferase [Oscillochloridaceae bacterium]
MTRSIAPFQPNMEASVTLRARDGREVRVRHMRRADAELLIRLFYRLSPETRYRRFFVPLNDVDEARVRQEAARLATIDPARETALIAIVDEEGREEAVAVARFARLQEHETACEASIVIRDDYQGVGIGRQLFDLLVQTAMARGFRHMILLTHADNAGMIALVQGLGMPYQGRYSSGLYEIDLQLTDFGRPIFPFTAPEGSRDG